MASDHTPEGRLLLVTQGPEVLAAGAVAFTAAEALQLWKPLFLLRACRIPQSKPGVFLGQTGESLAAAATAAGSAPSSGKR